jgi:hypothetical protein
MTDVTLISPSKRRRLDKANGHSSGSSSDSAAAVTTSKSIARVSPRVHNGAPSLQPPKKPQNHEELPRKRASGLRRTPVIASQVDPPKEEPETEEERRRRVAETLIREDEDAIAHLQEEIERLERVHAAEREREKDQDALMYPRPSPSGFRRES